MTDDDFRRLEEKVDRLTDAVTRLVIFEERQSNQGERLTLLDTRVANIDAAAHKLERKVDQWINLGRGAWALALVLFAIAELGGKVFK
jgi:hypothetical protein